MNEFHQKMKRYQYLMSKDNLSTVEKHELLYLDNWLEEYNEKMTELASE